MTRNQQLWCVYMGYVFMGVFLIAFWPLAGFVPPPDPSHSPQYIADKFQDHTTAIRLGMVICIFVSAVLLLWGAAISAQMKRIEGGWSPFVYAWIAGTACIAIEFIYPCVWWALAAFRPTADPEMIQRFNDMAWLAFLGVASTAIVQAVILGILTFMDKRSDPIYPRWFGYFQLWCGTLFIPAGLIFFFKDGPFAWNGLMAWWVVLTVFTAWMVVTTAMTARAIKRQPEAELGAAAALNGNSEIAALRGEVEKLRAEVAGVGR
jgi:hypothetical protein